MFYCPNVGQTDIDLWSGLSGLAERAFSLSWQSLSASSERPFCMTGSVQWMFILDSSIKETGASSLYRHYSTLPEWTQYGLFTDFQHLVIFSSGFSVLPQKINENLRTDFASEANMREIRSLYKILNINGLCMTVAFPPCKKHRLGMRYGPYQGLKCTISHPDMGVIGPWNRQNQNARWTIPDHVARYMKRRYGTKEP